MSTKKAQEQEKELHLHKLGAGSEEATNPRVKPSPKSGQEKIPVPFAYIPSDDGTDENLLILLHGLGADQIVFLSPWNLITEV